MLLILLLSHLTILQISCFLRLFNTFAMGHWYMAICLKQKAKDAIVKLSTQASFNLKVKNLILTTAF
jgi:hypothetical protein